MSFFTSGGASISVHIQVLALTVMAAVGIFLLWRNSVRTTARVRLLEAQVEAMATGAVGNAGHTSGVHCMTATPPGSSDDANVSVGVVDADEDHLVEVFGDEDGHDGHADAVVDNTNTGTIHVDMGMGMDMDMDADLDDAVDDANAAVAADDDDDDDISI